MLKTKLQRCTVRNYFYSLLGIVFILNILSPSVGFSQKNGSVEGCKKWFQSAVADFKKDKQSFVSKYCKIPFLNGSGGDAFYSYSRLTTSEEVLKNFDEYLENCATDIAKPKNLTFLKTTASTRTLTYLTNSYEYNERDEKGKRVNKNMKPHYDGLVTMGERIFIVKYNCGEKHPSYGVPPLYELYVSFDKTTQTYKFWASTSGL